MEFTLQHDSEVAEAGATRKVGVEIDAIAFEAQARMLAGAPLGSGIRVQGFLSAKRKGARKIVLHATQIEFLEGN